MPRIAVDAMGSDRAPEVELDGVAEAVREHGEARDLRVVLVGDEAALRAGLAARGVPDGFVEVRGARQVITMDDHPGQVFKAKPDASMRVCFDLTRSGEADAVVSAGNSGAMLALGLFVLKRMRGVDRPAIVTSFPTLKGPCALIDMGANVDVTAKNLAQFAVLGAGYARALHGIERPRLALLSNGTEDHKGTKRTREAASLLSRRRAGDGPGAFEFKGYCEGRDIFGGQLDVVVTDGFTGNVALKTAEGLAEAIMAMLKNGIEEGGAVAKAAALLLKPVLQSLKDRVDYAEWGGAPLVGVDGVAIVCHGGSSPKAVKNAILNAARFVSRGLLPALAASIEDHAVIWEAAAS